MKKGVTISDAAHKWVAELNKFPQDMIIKLMSIDIDSWREVTLPKRGDSVYLSYIPKEDVDGKEYEGSDSEGEIVEVRDDDTYIVELNDGVQVVVEADEFEVQYDDVLPMWGWMWQFGDSCDDYWLEDGAGIREMSDCGFRIYENDEWGYFFGIDGAGYDFYGKHWIPLYKARGLQWHDKEMEVECNE